MSCRCLCITFLQDWSGAALNPSFHGMIDNFGVGTASAESVTCPPHISSGRSFHGRGGKKHKLWLSMSGTSVTKHPNNYPSICSAFFRDTSTSSCAPLTAYNKGVSLPIPVLQCLETKGMQQLGVQCSGHWLPCLFQGVTSPDSCPFTPCWQGSPCEEAVPPDISSDNVDKQAIELVHNTTAAGFYSHLVLVPKKSERWRPMINLLSLSAFLEIPHFMVETAENIQRSLPQEAWVTSIDLVDAYFYIPIHRGYWKFLRSHIRDAIYQLGFHQGYEGNQSIGAWHRHPPVSIRVRLTDILNTLRSVSQRHSLSARTATLWASWFTRRSQTWFSHRSLSFWDIISIWFLSKSLRHWSAITKSWILFNHYCSGREDSPICGRCCSVCLLQQRN